MRMSLTISSNRQSPRAHVGWIRMRPGGPNHQVHLLDGSLFYFNALLDVMVPLHPRFASRFVPAS